MNTVIVTLLPVVFMFHDFEEIIFFKSWVNKNNSYLSQRFPVLSKRFLSHMESLSTAGFALAVAEEFIVLSLVTYGSLYFENYYLWLALFMAFFIHLIVHIVQWIVLGKYIPVIVTSLISLAYCVYVFVNILRTDTFRLSEIALWTVIGFLIMVVNLQFAHKLGNKLDAWLKVKS